MATPQRTTLTSLPVELLTNISDRLDTFDLKRFRMLSRVCSEAVFERMVQLMPAEIVVYGQRSASLEDLRFLGATFKMGEAVSRL